MKKRMTAILLQGALVSFIIFLASCSLPTYTPEQNEWVGKNIEENSSLFVKTDKKYVFNTNNPAYIKASGYTLWTRIKNKGVFENFKVTAKKDAGKSAIGYGVVFCETDASAAMHSMLCVLINLEGKYAIGKIENGKYKNIEWWQEGYEESTFRNALQKGLGAQNTIEVRYNEVERRYEVFFNGYKIKSFEDTRTSPVFTGRRGYVVILSANEGFPERNVHVEFEEE